MSATTPKRNSSPKQSAANTTNQAELDQLCINTIRTLALDAVQHAESGHPGLPLGCAPLAYVLWTKHLRFNPKNPRWAGRDRFLLSAGHGSMLIYALLHLTGYDLPLEELKNFRQWESKTPGHPENFMTPGVEITTGPLGQGFANGVGMGIGAAHLGARFNKPEFPLERNRMVEHFGARFEQPEFPLIDNYVYAICSDGDLMEGVSCEAASLAGHLGLGNLIYFYDDNHITIEGETTLAFTENVQMRFKAYGWHTLTVEDGNDLEAIDKAIIKAQKVKDKPSLISVKTIIGFGMPTAGTRKAHSDAPGEEVVKETKRALGWDENKTFYVPDEARAHFEKAVERGAKLEQKWNAMVERYKEKFPDEGKAWSATMSGELPQGWEDALPDFKDSKAMATRQASGEVINAIAAKLPMLIGGSADLSPSNNTDIKDGGNFQADNYAGRILHFGVREHAMGAALTGIALNGGLIPYGGTFFCFSDYMKPAIRLAALSGVQVIYVFTHDSIGLGEDGPTHQPIEQLAGLRAMPQLFTIRPADAHETREAWRIAIKRQKQPTALVLTRQKVEQIDRAKYATADNLEKGAYILAEAEKDGKQSAPDLIILATGSEVGLAMKGRDELQSKGHGVRVVSMPCWEAFEEQDDAYKAKVLPREVTKRLGIEAASRLGWDRYVGWAGDVICMTRFGSSSKGEVAMKNFGFNVENVVKRAEALLNKK